MKKYFQHLQDLLGARRGLLLRAPLYRRLLVFLGGAFVITALLSAQSPEPGAGAPPQPAPVPPPAPQVAPSSIDAAPQLSEPPMPPLGAAEPAPPAPQQPQPPAPAGTVLLEAQPLTNAASPGPLNATNMPAAPFAAPAAEPQPQATPLRAADVTFPTPASRAQNEPLVAIGRPVGRTDYGEEGNRKAAQLRSMPPERFTFDRALLRDVLRFLAEAAGIPFLSIPESSPEAQQLVTFRMTASPFAALEGVSRQNDVKLVYEESVWFMRTQDPEFERSRRLEDENELVGVIYQLRFDPGDRVVQGTSGGGPGGVGGNGGSAANQNIFNFGGSGGSSSGSGGTASSGGLGSPQLPLQNPITVFVPTAPKIVNDIRLMLGLRPIKYADDGGTQDPEVTGGTNAPALGSAGLLNPRTGEAAPSGEGAQAGARETVYMPPQKPQVIYNADNNVIWVVATRKQHRWVAEYLSKVDQPQDLVAIEVKFLETKKNPQYDLGINWGNMLGTGITVRGSANAGIGGEYSFGFDRGKEWGSSNFSSSSGGNSILSAISNAVINNRTNLTVQQIMNDAALNSLSGNSSSTNFSGSGSRTFNADFRGQNTAIPYEAVLSLDQVSLTLQAFMQDRDSSVVQYPRVLTINNREVAITSAENTPVNQGVQQTQSGSVATQTGTLGYLPIGTQINILPKLVGKQQIALTVAITISSIIGEQLINLGTGLNPYPITTSRVYNANLQVNSGYTLAVGGLEKVADSDVQGGVPILKDVPGLGYFFRNKNKKRDRVNLIIFITPYIISDPARTPGISETPISIVPQRPGGTPTAPTFTPDGRLSGGARAISEAFAWLEFQLRYFQQITIENMTSSDSIARLRDVIGVSRALLADLQAQAGQIPYDPSTPAGRDALRAEQLLTDLNRALAAAQEDLM